MLTKQDIINFCNSNDYDIRKNGNGRWIDQKCAADVVSVIADCICNYEMNNKGKQFSSLDIWHDNYTIENVEAIFKKPGLESVAAKNEYDKFFQQPMEMLANAQVLSKVKKGHCNFYSIKNYDVLEYIAIRERNALIFLREYIEKVLNDSGLYYIFDEFFQNQTIESYKKLKSGFSKFLIEYTKINGEVECNRIFIKVLNPLAYYKNSLGTERGHLSKQIITLDKLMYNRNNFRDICSDKPKGITRKEYLLSKNIVVNTAYYHYQSAKAKKFLRIFNEKYRNSRTEHLEIGHTEDKAIHMHHIFPESKYPEICYYLENIIALTPTQHLNYAHPDGKTQEINEQYQYLLLLSKTERIRENLCQNDNEKIYGFSNLLYVLFVGFDNDDISEINDMDFNSVINVINAHYSYI